MRYGDRRSLEPKPYVLIPFPASEPRRRPVEGHHTYDPQRYTGYVELRLHTLTPLQVASGFFDVLGVSGREQVVLQHAYRTLNGRRVLVVPATSLKGAVRSLVEIISPSCLPVVGYAVRPHAPRRLGRCTDIERLCPACSLFGIAGSRHNAALGRVLFEDAMVGEVKASSGAAGPTAGGQAAQSPAEVVSSPLLWTAMRPGRPLPGVYRDRNMAKGRKVYYHRSPARGPDAREALRGQLRLQSRLHISNLSRAEMGLLLAAMGLHPGFRFAWKLGGGKPVGLGSVEAEVVAVALAAGPGEKGPDTRGRLGGSLAVQKGEAIASLVRQWVQAAEHEGLIVRENLAQLAQALARSGLQQPAPQGPY